MFLHPLRNIPSSAASEIDHDIALGLRAADQHIALGRRLDRVGSIANDTARSYPYPHSRGPQPGESTGAAHGPTAEIDGNAEGRGSTTPRRRCDAKGTGPELRCEPQHDFETDGLSPQSPIRLFKEFFCYLCNSVPVYQELARRQS